MTAPRQTAKAMIPHERDVQRAVMDFLGAKGFRVFRRNTGAVAAEYKGKTRFIRFSQKGAADLYGWHVGSGRHIEVEVKSPGKKPSREQEAWLVNAFLDGAIAFWADSVERAQKELEQQDLREAQKEIDQL